jgi:hypothetical protein
VPSGTRSQPLDRVLGEALELPPAEHLRFVKDQSRDNVDTHEVSVDAVSFSGTHDWVQTGRNGVHTQVMKRFLTPSLPTHFPYFSSGSVNATILLPEGASFLPPPHTMTTYSRPAMSYTEGVALPAAGRTVSHNSFPFNLS